MVGMLVSIHKDPVRFPLSGEEVLLGACRGRDQWSQFDPSPLTSEQLELLACRGEAICAVGMVGLRSLIPVSSSLFAWVTRVFNCHWQAWHLYVCHFMGSLWQVSFSAGKPCYTPPNRNHQPHGSFCAAVGLLQTSVASTAKNLEAAVQPLQSCNSVHGGLTLHLTRPRLPTFSLLLETGQWPVFSLLTSHSHRRPRQNLQASKT